MYTISQIEECPPSSAAPLSAETVRKLPESSILHLRSIDPRDVTTEHHDGVRMVSCGPHNGYVSRWNPEFELWVAEEGFDSLEDLVRSHEIRYLRLPRLVCRSTEKACRRRSKTVTRRLNAGQHLRTPGALINLVDGARRPGVLVIGTVFVQDARREWLSEMPAEDLVLEGFSGDLDEFQREFRKMHRLVGEDPMVWRIEWEYVADLRLPP